MPSTKNIDTTKKGDAAKDQEKRVKLAAAYQSEDADISLVSSDDVIFKVHSYQLKAVSPVFRDMMKVGAADVSIVLSDTHLETAEVLKRFLDLVHRGTVLIEGSLTSAAFNISLIDLLRKYECAVALQFFETSIAKAITWQTSGALELFVLSASLGNILYAAKTIETRGANMWPKDDDVSKLESATPGARAFDLAGMPIAWFQLIPSEYAHAILRASAKRAAYTDSSKGWDVVAKEFERLLNDFSSKA